MDDSMAVSLAADWTGNTNLHSPAGGGASPSAALASAAASDSFLDGSLPFSSVSPDGELHSGLRPLSRLHCCSYYRSRAVPGADPLRSPSPYICAPLARMHIHASASGALVHSVLSFLVGSSGSNLCWQASAGA